MQVKTKTAMALAALAATGGLAGCGQNDADVVSKNLSTEADNFKIPRRIVVINDITDKYLLSINGLCSITPSDIQVDVICKVGAGYKKAIVGISDNVSYTVEQLDPKNVSATRYTVVIKPSTIVPSIELR